MTTHQPRRPREAGTPTTPDQAAQTVDLHVGGMTCASCAARIEKKLNRMPGVQASVNYATEKARVALPAGTDVEAAIATVEATGYTARRLEPPRPAQTTLGAVRGAAAGSSGAAREGAPENDDDSTEVAALRQRLAVSAALMLPVLAMAMIPPLQFDSCSGCR